MRAVGFYEFGGPDALRVLDLPEPHPGPGEVRVRVHAATVNPTDTGLRAGRNPERLAGLPAPHVPGMDLAGVVDEVGDGVAWEVGDRVMAMVVPLRPAGGAYADRVVLPAGSVAAVPAGADLAAAATLPMNGLTARLTLDRLALAPGQTLAVTGAAGAYGGYVVQLAKADGLRVVADASEADDALVRQLGADDVVRRGDDVADRIRAVVPGGVDGLADGAVMDALVVPAVRDGGGLAVVRGWDGQVDRGITVHRIWVSRMDGNGAALDRLRQQAEDGTVTLRVARTFPAEQAADAHRLLEAGGTRGRIVLDFTA
ncbi:MAG TPA: NADP-dependent oxidoreductase [Acidimicrobiales bacterium]|nr:NADP-dependent oxidoreductase [Acidimicrobiales bacterium]